MVLPEKDSYQKYPAKRYIFSHVKDKTVTVDGHSDFQIVNQEKPCRRNPANYAEKNGRYYKLYL